MTQWNERFKDHPVWKFLQDLGPAIDQALARDGNDPPSIELLQRLKAVQIFIGRRIAGADRYLLNQSQIDGINSSLQPFLTEVRNFIANGSVGHLNNANSHAENALNVTSQVNVPYTTEDFEGAKEAADSYRQTLDNAVIATTTAAAANRKELEGVRARIAELTAEITAEKARVTTTTTEFQSQFSKAQETRSSEYAEAQKGRQEAFAQLTTEYTTKLLEQNADFSKQRDDITRKHIEDVETLKVTFVDNTSKIRDEILKRKEEVENLLGVIGSMGITSGYQHSANEAKWTTRLWQGVTVIALLGLVGVAFYAILVVPQGTFTWSTFAGRLYISITFGLLAAYSASQADRYQKLERTNRRLALELQAMGPFMAPMTVDKQQEFRLKIGERSFGHRDEDLRPSDTSPTTLVEMLLHSKEFKGFIVEIVKAVK
jgi:hypothetical protein